MKPKKTLALLLAFAVVLSLSGCHIEQPGPTQSPSAAPSEQPSAAPTQEPSVQPSAAPSEQPSAEPTQEPSAQPSGPPRLTVPRLAVLSGPTGIGAAKLLSVPAENAQGYEYTIETDNSALVAGLTTGEIDIATMASNMAVNLYNKTNGGVRIIALGTLGVLHILEGGGKSEIHSIEDLAGKTIWSAGQGANPEYILRHLLEENDLVPGEDVTIVFADASEIQAKLLTGEIECAMLPVPAATAALIKGGDSVREAIDVTEAWADLDGSQLVMTAVVARTEFLETYPDAVAAFLKDYEASIEYVNSHVDGAAQMVADLGITPNAAIAKQAIPQCHLTYIDGEDMLPAISDYFRVLWNTDPASVGGFLPDDGIYYVP